ncbi:hypothetical protein NE237_025254 [Protea cynaroides]|uniref:Uncharacterized protein n=1 Tax=Protea cynaroides TaxID=273540 RepID=A0A9Q0K1K6_9MAGN|nr:hypothetical protein NE237_025254 [Protea cynaroides]
MRASSNPYTVDGERGHACIGQLTASTELEASEVTATKRDDDESLPWKNEWWQWVVVAVVGGGGSDRWQWVVIEDGGGGGGGKEILETREEEASKRFRACTCSIINRFSPWKPQLLIRTAHDLHKLYPKVVPSIQISKMNDATVQQGLAFFYNALKSVGDSWTENHKWLTTFGCKKDVKIEDIASQEFGDRVLEKLSYMIKIAREMFDSLGDNLTESYSNNKAPYCLSPDTPNSKALYCHSPETPTSVLPELISNSNKMGRDYADFSYSPPLLIPENQSRMILDEPMSEAQDENSNSKAKLVSWSKQKIREVKAATVTREITMYDSDHMARNEGGSVTSCESPRRSGPLLQYPHLQQMDPS